MRTCLVLPIMALLCLILAPHAHAQNCPRPNAGAVVQPPPDVYSQNGRLSVTLDYLSEVDSDGVTLYCFVMPTGQESPTLHVLPGDTVDILLVDKVPEPANGQHLNGSQTMMEMTTSADAVCGAATMDTTSVNIHFHGMNVPPTCHADEVIHTLVNSGQSFRYVFKIPTNEPPGMYWYHPHVHGQSEAAVLGGGAGAIEVEGIANVQPAVAGLPERFLVLRDQVIPGAFLPSQPGWNVSVNYVPILYPNYRPAIMQVTSGQQEFWRVVNASADTIMDVALVYDKVPQTLQIAALDGVPTGSQNGTEQGKLIPVTHVLIPPAGRAEFIATMPDASVRQALFVTRKIDTGSVGDNDPARPLAALRPVAATAAKVLEPLPDFHRTIPRFNGLARATVTATRTLYFSETFVETHHAPSVNRHLLPSDAVAFYITVKGQTPTVFSPTNPPAITTHQGAVEDWTIYNTSPEVHEFHIHQIHFLLMDRDGVPVPAAQRQLFDTVNVPAWSGHGAYPSITVRLDFRGPVVGDFVYHCHILGHEDAGMMAVIRVLPKSAA